MRPDHNRTEVNETFRLRMDESDLSVFVSRSRSKDHDHGHITDISVGVNKSGHLELFSIPAEVEEDFIRAMIDAHHRRKNWLREGTNWNLGTEGV